MYIKLLQYFSTANYSEKFLVYLFFTNITLSLFNLIIGNYATGVFNGLISLLLGYSIIKNVNRK